MHVWAVVEYSFHQSAQQRLSAQLVQVRSQGLGVHRAECNIAEYIDVCEEIDQKILVIWNASSRESFFQQGPG